MVLYINACVRESEISRTDRLARAVLEKFGNYKEIKLSEAGLKPLDGDGLEYRSRLLEKGDFDNDLFLAAKEFRDADIIVISAPYWDSSFPALLKVYLENIYIVGLVTEYDSRGIPQGLCKAAKLYYVTTAGGPYNPKYSYDYIRELAVNQFGIKDTELVFAQYLDIEGKDPEAILEKTIKTIENTK